MEVSKNDNNEEVELQDIPATSSQSTSADLTAHVSNSSNSEALAFTSSLSPDAEIVL